MTDPDPGRWCVYQEVGLMTGFQRIVIRTNGLVLGSTTGTMIAYPPPPFQELLTVEEKRYLEMWLEVTDFINLDLPPLANDADTLLQVYQHGQTNLVYVNYPQFEPLVSFFLRTIPNGKDPFHTRMQRLLNLKLTAYQEAIALLKSYLKAPKRADCASEALRVLSRSMPPKEWGEFLRSCLQDANPAQRKILVEAIQNCDWNLRDRLDDYQWLIYKALEAVDLVPLPLQVPLIIPNDGHFEMPTGPNIEPLPDWRKPRPPFLAPKGVTNLALGKKVTTSDPKVYGTLARITDGKKGMFRGVKNGGTELEDGVELSGGLQWVQVDLEQDYPIYAVVLWHNCDVYTAVFHDVIVQASSDPEFKQNVQTVFNNDHDNSAGFGKATDKEYPEWHEGKLIDTKGVKARYWRFYSHGSNYSNWNQRTWNQYLEIEIYGLSD